MKEFWNEKIGSFTEQTQKISDATEGAIKVSESSKEQTLKEFLKTDKARLRAFLSILKKSESSELDIDLLKEIKIIRMLDSVDLFIEQYKSGEHSTLEPRQIESLVKISVFLRSGRRRGFLELPTGLGKTVIFSELIEAFKDIPDIKILVVGSGNINAMQNSQKIEAFGGEEVGQYFAGKKDTSAKVTVCNYHGLRNAIKAEEFKPGDFDLVLLDEVHDGLGEVTQDSIKTTFSKEIIIGFSATATYELSRGDTASDFLPIEIDKMEIVEAVEGNLLSAFAVEIVKIPTTIRRLNVSRGDYNASDLDKEINTDERNGLIVQSYIDFYRKKESKTIAFCVGIQHAKDLAAAFQKENIPTAFITSESSIGERELVLKKWKEGEIEVLCGSKLIWQGLDETEVCIGLNIAPSLSEKDVIQRGGRLLRRSQVRNNKRSIIVEFLDEWRETKHRPLFYSEILQTASAEPIVWAKTKTSDDKEVVDYKEEKEVELTENPISDSVSDEIESPLPLESLEHPFIEYLPSEEDSVKPEEVETQVAEKTKIPRMTRHTSAKEIMSISNQNRRFRNEGYFDYAPKGWMSANIIAVELGTTTREIEHALSQMKNMRGKQKRIYPKIYLSSLGIKRPFYEPKVVDEIYLALTKSTRSEKVSRGELIDVETFESLEQDSLSRERKEGGAKDIDLDWHDYDLTPSFTLEGESLDDEEDGTYIGDTTELHPDGEPVEGRFNDLIGYRYPSLHGKVFNTKVALKFISPEKLLGITDRYGVHPSEEFFTHDNFEPTSADNELERKDMYEAVMKIFEEELDEREQTVIKRYIMENDGSETFRNIGKDKDFGLVGQSVRNILAKAFKKIRLSLKIKNTQDELKWGNESGAKLPDIVRDKDEEEE